MKYKEKRINVLFVAAVKIRHMLSETNETKKNGFKWFQTKKKETHINTFNQRYATRLGRQYI